MFADCRLCSPLGLRGHAGLCLCSLPGVGVLGSKGGRGEGGQLEQGVAEAGLVGVGTGLPGWHGTLPCLSDLSPCTLHCLEGDAPVASDWRGVCTNVGRGWFIDTKHYSSW